MATGINTTVGMLQKDVWISWLSVFNVKTTRTVLKTHLGIVKVPYPLILIMTTRGTGCAVVSEKYSIGTVLEAVSIQTR